MREVRGYLGVLQNIANHLGFTAPEIVRLAIAKRNMPIVAIGSGLAALFAGLLSFSLLANVQISVDGFYTASHENEAVTLRYTVSTVITFVVLLCVMLFEIFCLRRKWEHLRLSTCAAVVFAYAVAMLWGIADSGRSADSQLIIFASIQFLVAGLIILNPPISLTYFIITFSLFGIMLNMYGQLAQHTAVDLAYLCAIDIIVSWIVYGMFRKNVMRSVAVADMSRRDELTGAKNRHYLRDDFPHFSKRETFIMFCDIDDFKRYNDEFGHDVGDALLRDFYFALRDAFGDECVYRYGGDEFLVLSPDLSEQDFLAKVRKCEASLKDTEINDENAHLTFSGGYVYGIANDMNVFREMLHTADSHLLHTKQSGKAAVNGGVFAEGEGKAQLANSCGEAAAAVEPEAPAPTEAAPTAPAAAVESAAHEAPAPAAPAPTAPAPAAPTAAMEPEAPASTEPAAHEAPQSRVG